MNQGPRVNSMKVYEWLTLLYVVGAAFLILQDPAANWIHAITATCLIVLILMGRRKNPK